LSEPVFTTVHAFPTTHWSLVARVGHDDGSVRRAALVELLTRYLPALRTHLVLRKGLRRDRADDVLQQFLADKVLEDDLIPRARREKGKFRTFLLTALDRFVANVFRHEAAQKRRPAGEVPLEEAAGEADDAAGPAAAFDAAWARQVVAQGVEATRFECEASARPDVWGVFEARVLGPTLDGADPVPHEQLAERFGFRSAEESANLLVTGKRMFARNLRAVVGRYEPGEAEIDAEIADLRATLSGT
jgi:RNA polymerase sigma-70 factor (ECF subfamily)